MKDQDHSRSTSGQDSRSLRVPNLPNSQYQNKNKMWDAISENVVIRLDTINLLFLRSLLDSFQCVERDTNKTSGTLSMTLSLDLMLTLIFQMIDHITRTSEYFISLGRTQKVVFVWGYLTRVQRMSEIALHKNNQCGLQPRLIKYQLVHVCIPIIK